MGPAVQKIHCFLWVLFLRGEYTENWLFHYVQTKINLFEVTECLPSHTQVGVGEGSASLPVTFTRPAEIGQGGLMT